MSYEPTSYPSPWPPYGAEMITPAEEKAATAAAAAEASEREMAFVAALGRVPPQAPAPQPVKAPVLPNDFKERITELDAAVFKCGIAVDRDKLLQGGKECFAKLLESDRIARAEQRVIGCGCDLSDWPSVERCFQMVGAFELSTIPRRRTSEIAAGHGKEREAARTINGFFDLWKASASNEPRAVRAVYEFYDRFVLLAFGKSMLERISDDGRLRSHFFCGGHGAKVKLFADWLAVLKSELVRVRLRNPLWTLVAWLADEQAQPPAVHEIASEFYGCRAPDRQQIRTVEALLDGFALGFSDWALWQFVGRRTRSVTPLATQLTDWRKALARRYPRIEQFHAELRSAFYRSVGANVYDAHTQFDAGAHRGFIQRNMRDLLSILGAVVALATDDKQARIVARFDDWLLLEGKPPKFLESRIESELATAFPASSFQIAVSEGNP